MTVGLYIPTRLAIAGFDYDFTFKADVDTELIVATIVTVDSVEVPTLLTLGTDYIVTLSEVVEGGTVQTGSYVLAVWTPAEPSGEEILIQRATPRKQSTDIPVRGGFKESVIEGGLDDLSKQIQELAYTQGLLVADDSEATANSIVRAEAAADAAELAQAAAEVAEAGAESAVDDAIDDLVDVTTGHRHDGVDARKVLVTSLGINGITDGHFLKRSGAGVVGEEIITTGLSNVIFTWSGIEDAEVTQSGVTPLTFLRFRFTKIAGIDSITIHARIKSNTADGAKEGVVTVDIGGQSDTAHSVTSTSLTWYEGGTPIDVSGLVDGTTYDGVVQISNENISQDGSCSAVTLIAS